MLRLIKLNITSNEPLYVSFLGKVKEETYNEITGDCEINKRESSNGILEPIKNGEFLIQNKEDISQLLTYFFRNCDSDKSPQSLWETKRGIKYISLLKDYRATDKELFDDIIYNIFNIIKIENVIDINQISQIEISYPENWKVDYEKSKTHNLKNIII